MPQLAMLRPRALVLYSVLRDFPSDWPEGLDIPRDIPARLLALTRARDEFAAGLEHGHEGLALTLSDEEAQGLWCLLYNLCSFHSDEWPRGMVPPADLAIAHSEIEEACYALGMILGYYP